MFPLVEAHSANCFFVCAGSGRTVASHLGRKMVYQGLVGPLCEMFVKVS